MKNNSFFWMVVAPLAVVAMAVVIAVMGSSP
jgi:hypothetical protein